VNDLSRRQKCLILLVLIVSLFVINVVATATTVSEVEKGLMCYCGCNMTLYSCECADAAQMRSDIQKMIDQGMTKDEIIKNYVKKYGNTILASPPKKGFDLIAWVIPGIIILISGFLVWMFIKKGVLSSKSKSKKSLDNSEVEEYDEQIEEEIKKYL